MSEGFRFRLDHLLVGVLGGLVGGAVVWAATPAPPPAASADTTTAPSELPMAPTELPGGPESAPPRIAQLETEMRDLRQRMTEQAKVEAVEETDDQGEGRVTLSASDPKFKHAVRTILDQAKHDAEEQEQERREDWNERRIVRQVDEMVTSFELSDEQADEVEAILFEQSDAFRDVFQGDKRPVTRKEWGTTMQRLRDETRTKLAKVLDESQLKQWDEDQANQWGRGFGRGPR